MSEIGAVGGDGRGYDEGTYDYEPSAPIRDAGAPTEAQRGDRRKNIDLARGAGHDIAVRPHPRPPPKPPEPVHEPEPVWTPSGFVDHGLNALAVMTHNPQIADAIGDGAMPIVAANVKMIMGATRHALTVVDPLLEPQRHLDAAIAAFGEGDEKRGLAETEKALAAVRGVVIGGVKTVVPGVSAYVATYEQVDAAIDAHRKGQSVVGAIVDYNVDAVSTAVNPLYDFGRATADWREAYDAAKRGDAVEAGRRWASGLAALAEGVMKSAPVVEGVAGRVGVAGAKGRLGGFEGSVAKRDPFARPAHVSPALQEHGSPLAADRPDGIRQGALEPRYCGRRDGPRPGTPEHKAARWEQYQQRRGTLPYETWSRIYEANIRRPALAGAAVDGYHAQLGWGRRELSVDVEGVTRRLDIGDEPRRRGVEHKTGYQTLTRENLWEIARDEILRADGWDIRWHFEGRASAQLKEALRSAGIPYTGGD